VDGKYLAFEVNQYSGEGITLHFSEVNAAIAKDARAVSLPGGSSSFGGSNQVIVNPTWHPDGLSVFEGSNQGGQFQLYFAQPNGASAAEMLSTSKAPGDLTFPMVSPDGRLLAFVSDQTGNGDIRTWDRSTDAITQLTDSSSAEMFPMFSEDGGKILFSRKVNNTEDIFELDISSKSETPIAGGGGDQTRPIYGAGGSVLYFSGAGESKWNLVATSGGSKKTLAKEIRLPLRARPALSQDGRWAAFTYDDPAKSGSVYLAAVDGSRTVTIKTDFEACGEPALTTQNGRVLLAYTALPDSGADWRFLYVEDITDKL